MRTRELLRALDLTTRTKTKLSLAHCSAHFRCQSSFLFRGKVHNQVLGHLCCLENEDEVILLKAFFPVRKMTQVRLTTYEILTFSSLFKRAKHNTTRHDTTQHNTTQHNTTQHNTTQHNTTELNLSSFVLNTKLSIPTKREQPLLLHQYWTKLLKQWWTMVQHYCPAMMYHCYSVACLARCNSLCYF